MGNAGYFKLYFAAQGWLYPVSLFGRETKDVSNDGCVT